MRFSLCLFGILFLGSSSVLISSTSETRDRVCRLTGSLSFPFTGRSGVLDEFEQLIVCDLDVSSSDMPNLRENFQENARAFAKWKSEQTESPKLYMGTACGIELDDTDEYKTIMENMLKASHFIIRPLIRPSTNTLCLLARIIKNTAQSAPLRKNIRIIVQKFWRNFLTEHFAKYQKYHRSFFLSNDVDVYSRPQIMMRGFAERCGSKSIEYVYRAIQFRFGTELSGINWIDLGSLELKALCQFATKWIDGYYQTIFDEEQTYHKIGKSPPRDTILDRVKVDSTKRHDMLKATNPHLSVQICYYDLYDRARIRQLPSESSISRHMSYSLGMNQDELTEYCGYVKEYIPSETEGRMIQLALKSISRQADILFAIFQQFTGKTMRETTESRFYQFIESASKMFDISQVLDIWISASPFKMVLSDDQKICGSYPSDPARLSDDSRTWHTIKRMAMHFSSWSPDEQVDFCSIVNSLMWEGVRKVDASLKKFEDLLQVNKDIPQINHLCGRITRLLPLEINLGVFDGLVAEIELQPPTKGKGCKVIRDWNHGEILTADALIEQLEVAARTPHTRAPSEASSHSMMSKWFAVPRRH